ncbi:MAG: hypothetical protein QOH13_221 [Thermoleophilaceae bacterium]|jgi:hypothetical protein|nr:hypothetical protein [Thermoleophilaceae bacterium]
MASRKDQKEKLRQERLEREQADAAAAARRRRMGYAVAGALVAAVVVALLVVVLASGGKSGTSSASSGSWPSGSIPAQKETDIDAAAKAAGCTLSSPKSEGRGHVTGHVNYKSQPPTSGSHNPVPSSDAAYLKPPTLEHLVHALEHGRVIYWFKPNAPASVRGALKKLYDQEKALVILTPDPKPMPYEVAATAWGQLLGCPKYNDRVPDAFRTFRDAYRLKGPEYFPNAE